jgi:hypothetical protein
MARKHSTAVTHKSRSNAPGYDARCSCGWGSYGHDTHRAADASGKQHEAARNR